MYFQWPNFYLKPKQFKYKKKNTKCVFLKKKIETFFLNLFGYRNIVVPSARSGISLILKFMKLNRKNEIFINKWSTRCVLDAASFFSNPTTNIKTANAYIINHTWGIEKKIKLKNKKNIIEDSADTIHQSSKSFFINGSNFEVVSLPKIIGSYAGGIIFFKDKNFIKFLKKVKFNKELSLSQSILKYKYSKTQMKKYLFWQYYEYENFDLDFNTLNNIYCNLKNLKKNRNIILKRQRLITQKLNIKFNNNRIGPVACLDLRKFKIISKRINLPIYHVNYSNSILNKFFLKSLVLPLHMGISDKKFNFILNNVIKK